ncbi:MAG: hypothetical protein MUF31_01515 [Akkermansiaceae bacterium]|jgi:hypothetical protein|nr:hypothetical protein [Akkermansiaceae bacterium]
MTAIIPSCTTAVSSVPEWHRALFDGHEETLTSPAGWSPGALNLAQGIAMQVHIQLVHAEYTRLLIDLSRHPDDEARWSEHALRLTDDQRRKLDERQKTGFLAALSTRISLPLQRGEKTVHVHVDTPALPAGTALRFRHSPAQTEEKAWIERWSDAIRQRLPGIGIEVVTDASRDLHSYLRETHPGLLSISLEANSSCFLTGTPLRWTDLRKTLLATLPRGD